MSSRTARIAAATAVGAVAGAWSGGLLALTAVAARHGWLLPGVVLPPDLQYLARPDITPLYARLWHATGLPLPSAPLPLFLTLLAAGAVFGLLIGLWSATASGKPTAMAFGSLAWSFRQAVSFPTSLVLLTGLLLPAAAALGAVGIAVVLACWLAALLFLPLGLFRPDVVSGHRLGPWWRIRWPGWSVALAFVLLVSVQAALGWLLDLAALPALPSAIGRLALVPIDLLAAAVLLALDPRLVACVSALRPDRLIAWYSLHLAWLVVVVLAAAPALSVYLVIWKVVPAAAAALSTVDTTLPLPWRYGIWLARLIASHFWMFLMPAYFVGVLSAARLGSVMGLAHDPRSRRVSAPLAADVGS